MIIKKINKDNKESESITIQITFETNEELQRLYDSQSYKFTNVYLNDIISNIKQVINKKSKKQSNINKIFNVVARDIIKSSLLIQKSISKKK